MRKPSFNDFSEAMRNLAIKAHRTGHANAYLEAAEAEKACNEFSALLSEVSNKYGFDSDVIMLVAIGIAESCDLGLAY